MIIIEKNLEQLASQYSICDKVLLDDYSIKLQLGSSYYETLPFSGTVVYGCAPTPSTLFAELKTVSQNLTLDVGQRLICATRHVYRMPVDYFGLVQTKGTLARLFVIATCNDGQVEPGFEGFITLELVNLSPWKVEIPIGSDIAQMYLIKCSSPAANKYRGRYATGVKAGPTIPIFSL